MNFLYAAMWLVGGLALAALFFVGLSSDGPLYIMAQAAAFKLTLCVVGAAILRLTAKAFDTAIGLEFRNLMKNAEGTSFVLPVLNYVGARFIGLCILFGLILSS